MKNNELVIQTITFVLLAIAQIVFFGKLSIYNVAFCFAFITFIFYAPNSNGKILNLLLAFSLGLLIDVFNNTLGINAFCCTFLAFIRNGLFGFLRGQNKEEQLNTSYTIKGIGFPYLSIFVFISSFIYTLLYFVLSKPNWIFMLGNLSKAFASSILTTAMIISINILFLKGKKAR